MRSPRYSEKVARSLSGSPQSSDGAAILVLGCLGFVLALACIMAVGGMAPTLPSVVVSGSSDRAGELRQYSVHDDWFRRDRLEVKLETSGKPAILCAEQLQIERVRTHRWLRDEEAVVIEIDARQRGDSTSQPINFRLLYEFDRGRLFTNRQTADCGEIREGHERRNLPDSDFEAMLQQSTTHPH